MASLEPLRLLSQTHRYCIIITYPNPVNEELIVINDQMPLGLISSTLLFEKYDLVLASR